MHYILTILPKPETRILGQRYKLLQSSSGDWVENVGAHCR